MVKCHSEVWNYLQNIYKNLCTLEELGILRLDNILMIFTGTIAWNSTIFSYNGYEHARITT